MTVDLDLFCFCLS